MKSIDNQSQLNLFEDTCRDNDLGDYSLAAVEILYSIKRYCNYRNDTEFDNYSVYDERSEYLPREIIKTKRIKNCISKENIEDSSYVDSEESYEPYNIKDKPKRNSNPKQLKNTRRIKKLSNRQYKILEKKYSKNKYPNIYEIACELSLPGNKIRNWFQNRRAKDRRKKRQLKIK
jgi:hypothetical protein